MPKPSPSEYPFGGPSDFRIHDAGWALIAIAIAVVVIAVWCIAGFPASARVC